MKLSTKKVPTIKEIGSKSKPMGLASKMKAAMINPILTSLMPESECFILVIFLRSFQNGTMKSTRIKPGRLMPRTARKAPKIVL